MFEYEQKQNKQQKSTPSHYSTNNGVIQRRTYIDLRTPIPHMKPREGKSGYGNTDSRKISTNWSATKAFFESNIKEKNINRDGEARPIYQCAEPNALVKTLNGVHDWISNTRTLSAANQFPVNWMEDTTFSKLRKDSYTRVLPSKPCAVCTQWIDDKWVIDHKGLINTITKETRQKVADKKADLKKALSQSSSSLPSSSSSPPIK